MSEFFQEHKIHKGKVIIAIFWKKCEIFWGDTKVQDIKHELISVYKPIKIRLA